MSDDIPPLIPETPPPMTKLDWEDDEDFMDFPHLALEMPSESSLSPDGGWNPIDELILPYDRDLVDKPVDSIESITNDSLSKYKPSGITKNDQSSESSLSEQEPSLHHTNVSIWKDKNTVPDIKKLTSDNSCDNVIELDCKTEITHNVSFENVIDSNKKITNDDLSVITEQHTCGIENVKNNTTLQYLPNLELQLNNLELVEHNGIVQSVTNINSEKLSHRETLVNGNLKYLDIKEINLNQTKCIDNILEDLKSTVSDDSSKLNSSNGMCEEMFNNNLPVNNSNNNNNNNIIKNDVGECTDVCDYESPMSNSINKPLPNRTSEEHNEKIEICSPVGQHHTLDQISYTQTNNEHNEMLQNVVSNNIDCSIFQNMQINDNNFEDNADSEFDEFCDFHAFSTTENNPTSVDNFCDFKTSKSTFNDAVELTNPNVEEVKFVTNYDDNLTFQLDNQNNTMENDNDIFCDFESGVNENHKVLDNEKYDKVLVAESKNQVDYKQLCKDAFHGDYKLCEDVNLQNLDNELNESLIWQNLRDVESSPALNYNWSKSESNNVFLSSLSIDSRNILNGGASWNTKFPRFAANMSNSPLEPLKASNNDTTETKISQSFSKGPLQETVPDPEFDWKSSGLINPLDCSHTSLLDLELLDTLVPCCTNTLQPQTWKTSNALKEDESYVRNSSDSVDVFDEFFSVSSSDNHSAEIDEGPSAVLATVSLEARRILENLPNFDVLQKPYLVILEKKNNSLFFN